MFPMLRPRPLLSIFFVVAVVSAVPVVYAQDSEPPPAQTDVAEDAGGDASVVVVLDTSEIPARKFNEMRKAASQFVETVGGDYEIALVSAGAAPTLVADFTSEPETIVKQIAKLRPKKKTGVALREAVRFASSHAASDALGGEKSVVVFATNLDAQHGSNEPSVTVEEGRPIPVYVIAAPKSKWNVQEDLQQLAANTGGIAFFPAGTSELKDIVRETAARVTGEPADESGGKEEKEEARREENILRDYQRVVVRDIPVMDGEDTAEIAGGESSALHDILLARLQKANIFRDVVNGAEQPDSYLSASASSGPTVELRASVLQYRRGNRAQRQLLGLRGGSKMKVRVVLVDAATHKPLLAFTKQGKHASGLFGGSQQSVQKRAMTNVADQIVAELKRAR